MSNAIAPQFVGHNFPGFTAMISEQTLEEPLSSSAIASGLQIHIHHLTVLVNSSPQVTLLTVDPHEDFIDEESVTVTLVLSLQSTSV